MTRSKSEKMGKVTTTITITNRIDQILVERGFIPAEQVRSITLHENQKLRVLLVEGKDTYLMVL